MKPTAEELFEIYHTLNRSKLENAALINRLDALVRQYREEQGQCKRCGEDCACADERAEWENDRARDEGSAA